MKSDLPKNFRVGDELTVSLINDILEELWRWRESSAEPPIHISEADSDNPPIWSFSPSAVVGQMFPGTTGPLGGSGFGTGTPNTPYSYTDSSNRLKIYTYEAQTGFPNTNYIQIPDPDTNVTTKAYNTYSTTVAANKTAWYWRSPSTGNYYIITADC